MAELTPPSVNDSETAHDAQSTVPTAFSKASPPTTGSDKEQTNANETDASVPPDSASKGDETTDISSSSSAADASDFITTEEIPSFVKPEKRFEKGKAENHNASAPMQSHQKTASPAPQRRRAPQSGRPSVTEYYINLSRRFRALKFICIAVFVLFTITVVTFNRDRITIENFQYMLRYLDVDTSSYGDSVNRISYQADANLKIDVYRGDLAIAAGNSITVKSPSGNIILDHSNNIVAPIPVPSDKYLLLYDLGGKEYALYNTFTCLHTGQYEYPITCAACADNGSYALVTSSSNYRSVVHIYDKNFKQISRISKDKLVMDLAFNEDGSRLVILSAYAEDGEFCTELQILDPYSDIPIQTLQLRDVFPISVDWHDDSFSVIFGDSIRFYSDDGTLIACRTYRKTPITFASNENYVAVVANDNAIGDVFQVQILNRTGESVFSGHVSGKIISVAFSTHYAYVLSSTAIYRIDPINATMQSNQIDARSASGLAAISDQVLFVTYASEAISINTSAFYENCEALPSEGIVDLPTAITDQYQLPSAPDPENSDGTDTSDTTDSADGHPSEDNLQNKTADSQTASGSTPVDDAIQGG